MKEWAKRHAPALALAAIGIAALTGLLTLTFARLPPPSGRIGSMAALGTSLAIVGLAVSLAGFAITLHQLAEARSDIDAAAKESARIKLSLRTYDATQDATRAEYALKEAKRHFDLLDFKSGKHSYSEYAASLSMIGKTVESLPIEVREQIVQADNYIEQLCIRIDKGINPVDFKQEAEMRSHVRLIRLIQTHLQRTAI